MALDEVDGSGLNRVLLAEARGVVIDFWGTWCQPCRTMRPHLERLADDHAERWRMVAVHVDAHPDVVDRYGVTSTPTLVFVRGGEEVERLKAPISLSHIAEVMSQR
jgi:thioredoxin